jgi:hypothetical protein
VQGHEPLNFGEPRERFGLPCGQMALRLGERRVRDIGAPDES